MGSYCKYVINIGTDIKAHEPVEIKSTVSKPTSDGALLQAEKLAHEDLSRTSKRVLREWPTCNITSRPTTLDVRWADDGFARAGFYCRVCSIEKLRTETPDTGDPGEDEDITLEFKLPSWFDSLSVNYKQATSSTQPYWLKTLNECFPLDNDTFELRLHPPSTKTPA